MPGLRLEDASCAICMDNLFDLRDDLDEVLPIATPDCGHVFHEKCLLSWFRSQSDAYIAQMSDQGVDASPADAPAECPECRTECFADPETGDPAVHRLFINFTNPDGNTSFTQPPSSQHVPSSPSVRWRSADKDVLGLARRARGLGAEIEAYSAESHEEDVRGTLRRAEGLRADAVSAKAAEGFKKYVGGLNVALNRLSTRLEEHPLLSTLEGRIATLQDKLAAVQRENARSTADLKARLTHDMRSQIHKEQARAEKEVKRAQGERDLMQREMEKQKIALQAFKKAVVEREAAQEAKLAEAQRIGALEAEGRKDLARDLVERTKTLKMWQAKAEKRADLKRRVQELTTENEALRKLSPLIRTREQSGLDDMNDNNLDLINNEVDLQSDSNDADPDLSAQEIPMVWNDDDLVIEEPPATLDSLPSSMEADRKAKRSLTARTYSFNEPEVRRSTTAHTFTMDAKRKASTSATSMGTSKSSGKSTSRLPSNSISKTVASASAKAGPSRQRAASPTPSRSKYFAAPDLDILGSSPSLGSSTRRPQGHILVDSSSPMRRPSPAKRPLSVADEIIEINSSPERPERHAPLKARSRPYPAPANPRTYPRKSADAPARKAMNMLDYLGVSDGQGRLKKGVVTGAKAKRRA